MPCVRSGTGYPVWSHICSSLSPPPTEAANGSGAMRQRPHAVRASPPRMPPGRRPSHECDLVRTVRVHDIHAGRQTSPPPLPINPPPGLFSCTWAVRKARGASGAEEHAKAVAAGPAAASVSVAHSQARRPPSPYAARTPGRCERMARIVRGQEARLHASAWRSCRKKPPEDLQILRPRAQCPDVARKPARDRKPVADHVEDRAGHTTVA